VRHDRRQRRLHGGQLVASDEVAGLVTPLLARRGTRGLRDATSVREAFLTGSSPSDFPAEHYERPWTNRFHLEDLNETGRRGLGLGLG
jgi:hypothetical protein